MRLGSLHSWVRYLPWLNKLNKIDSSELKEHPKYGSRQIRSCWEDPEGYWNYYDQRRWVVSTYSKSLHHLAWFQLSLPVFNCALICRCTFDIIAVDTNFQNKTPVLHLENCLGLESWCVKHVYLYCYTELMDIYFCKPKRKSLKVSSVNSERLVKLLNVSLLLSPELTTLWNKRRELVDKKILHKKNEIRFTTLVLSRKPKCNDAFGYRRWLLECILKGK